MTIAQFLYWNSLTELLVDLLLIWPFAANLNKITPHFMIKIILLRLQNMASLKTPEQFAIFLNSQEKTFKYALSQIMDGDLMNGKSILDITLLQL